MDGSATWIAGWDWARAADVTRGVTAVAATAVASAPATATRARPARRSMWGLTGEAHLLRALRLGAYGVSCRARETRPLCGPSLRRRRCRRFAPGRRCRPVGPPSPASVDGGSAIEQPFAGYGAVTELV